MNCRRSSRRVSGVGDAFRDRFRLRVLPVPSTRRRGNSFASGVRRIRQNSLVSSQIVSYRPERVLPAGTPACSSRTAGSTTRGKSTPASWRSPTTPPTGEISFETYCYALSEWQHTFSPERFPFPAGTRLSSATRGSPGWTWIPSGLKWADRYLDDYVLMEMQGGHPCSGNNSRPWTTEDGLPALVAF